MPTPEEQKRREEVLADNENVLRDNRAVLSDNQATLHDTESALQDNREALTRNRATLSSNRSTLRDNETALHDNRETLRTNASTLLENQETLRDQRTALTVLDDVKSSIRETAMALTEVSNAIREEVHIELRTSRRTQIPMLAMLAILICLAIMNFYMIGSNRSTSDQIYGCTEPSGACYQRNVKATGEAVANLNQQGERREQEIIDRTQCIVKTGLDCPLRPTTTTTSTVDPAAPSQ